MKRNLKKALAFVLAIALFTASLTPIAANAATSTSKESAISKTKSGAILIPAQYDDVAVWDYGALVFEKGEIYTSLGKDSKVYMIDTVGNKRAVGNAAQGNKVGIARRKYFSVSKDYYQIPNLQYGVMVEKDGKYGFYNNQNKLMHNRFYKNMIPTKGGYILTEPTKTSIYNISGNLVKTYSQKELNGKKIVDIEVAGNQLLIYEGNMQKWWEGTLYDIINQKGKSLEIPGGDFSKVQIIENYNTDYIYYTPQEGDYKFSVFIGEKEIIKKEPGYIIGDATEVLRGSAPYYNSTTKKQGVISLQKVLLKPEYDEIIYCNYKSAIVRQDDTVSILYYDGKTKPVMTQEQLKRIQYESISKNNYIYQVVNMQQKDKSIAKAIINFDTMEVVLDGLDYEDIQIIDNDKIAIVSKRVKNDTGSSLKYGLISFNGKELLSVVYDSIRYIPGNVEIKNNEIRYGDNIYEIKKEHKYGIANAKGKIIIKCNYNSIEPEQNGFKAADYTYIVRDENNKYGLLDGANRILLPIEYKGMESIKNKQYIIGTYWDGNCGIIDSSGKEILEQKYGRISFPKEETVLLNYATEDKKWEFNSGLYGLDGTVYVEATSQKGYASLSSAYYSEESLNPILNKEIIIISNNKGKYGIVDRKGKELLKFQYDKIYNYDTMYQRYMGYQFRYIDTKDMISPEMENVEKESLTNVKSYILKEKDNYGLLLYFKEQIKETEKIEEKEEVPKKQDTELNQKSEKKEEAPKKQNTEIKQEEVKQEIKERIHIVVKGDTMGSIATKYYGNNASRTALYNYNKDAFAKTKGKLVIGMKLRIPEKINGQNRLAIPELKQNEKLYIVKLGDTLSKIARKVYKDGSKYKIIYERNRDRIKNVNMIYVGQEIVIPDIN